MDMDMVMVMVMMRGWRTRRNERTRSQGCDQIALGGEERPSRGKFISIRSMGRDRRHLSSILLIRTLPRARSVVVRVCVRVVSRRKRPGNEASLRRELSPASPSRGLAFVGEGKVVQCITTPEQIGYRCVAVRCRTQTENKTAGHGPDKCRTSQRSIRQDRKGEGLPLARWRARQAADYTERARVASSPIPTLPYPIHRTTSEGREGQRDGDSDQQATPTWRELLWYSRL